MRKPVPRVRKHKARARALQFPSEDGQSQPTAKSASNDTKVAVILPNSVHESDHNHVRLGGQLHLAKSESKISARKRRRLDRYIDTKLKKEENLDLIKKLEQQADNFDVSFLRSAKTLRRSAETKKTRPERTAKETGACVKPEGVEDVPSQSSGSPASVDHLETFGALDPQVEHTGSHAADEAALCQATPTLGASLKRPLTFDDDGKPIIKKAKKSKRVLQAQRAAIPATRAALDGFSSGSQENSLQDTASSGASDSETSESGSLGIERASREISSGGFVAEYAGSVEENTQSSSDDETGKETRRLGRASAFKSWATQQRHDALGFQPSNAVESDATLAPSRSRSDMPPQTVSEKSKVSEIGQKHDLEQPKYVGHLRSFQLPNASIPVTGTVFNVPVERPSDVQEARLALPVVAEEQKIMEAISSNDCTVIWGQTGSGKTTQVPQFLYEAGYGSAESPNPGMIGVTQPRRVAAVSMAKRVAKELGDTEGKVSFQIRFDSSASSNTAIKFMTDGVLLREVTNDFILSKYSAIIVDEAHERSINTDILIGILSRVVETRAELAKKSPKHKSLKLIIMSATLRVTEFTANKFLFRRALPQVVQAEGRQYPVTIHFARQTRRDYVEETFRKVCKGHKRLPPGGMLVFLTGQNEINNIAQKLREAFPSAPRREIQHPNVRYSADTAMLEDEDLDLTSHSAGFDEAESDSSSDIRGLDNDEDDEFEVLEDASAELKVHVLPLYSQLPTELQMRVFEPTPENSRMIVLATNVAETSLTIPGIRYIFDCGRAKERNFDRITGIQTFEIGWISKASASQRAGRAGRTGPGHCYRLYSSAVFERDFTEFSTPEIDRTQIEGVVMQLKRMGIPNISNFPFPSPPSPLSLVQAEKLLERLGALSNGAITTLGEHLAVYPLSPRLSRIIIEGFAQNMVGPALTVVSALAVNDIFVPEGQLGLQVPASVDTSEKVDALREATVQDGRRQEYNAFHKHLTRVDRTNDALKLLVTLCDYIVTGNSNSTSHKYQIFTRTKALNEAIQLRRQLAELVELHHPGTVDKKAAPVVPPKAQIGGLRKVVAAGYIDQIAIRADLSPSPPSSQSKSKRAIDVPYKTLFKSHSPLKRSQQNGGDERDEFVYIHPSSVLAQTTSLEKLPQFLVYSQLSKGMPPAVASSNETHPNLKTPKTRLHPLTPVHPTEIIKLAAGTPLLEDSKPLGKIERVSRADCEDGKERRICWTTPFLVGEPGTLGWPLPPARKVLQKRERSGWVVEKILSTGTE